MTINYLKIMACCMVMLIAGMTVGELYHSSEGQVCPCCKKACEHGTKACVCNHAAIQYALPEANIFLKPDFSELLSSKEAKSNRILFVYDIFHPPKCPAQGNF